MATLHQLRCFLAAYEHGSLTAAATALGFSQPSLSEQVRLLEQGLGTALFQRVGRGVVPTEAGEALRPHAERTLEAAADASRAVAAVNRMETGTLRFGVFGTHRLYLGTDLVAEVLTRFPGLRVELIGQNSAEVIEDLRRGRLEAAMISLPVAGQGLDVHPAARDEMVYLSADPDRLRQPVTPRQLAAASLVLPEASWGNEDSSRRQLARAVQQVGSTLTTRVEVEDVETAVELAARGLADTVAARSIVHSLRERIDGLGWVPFRPRLYDAYAVVHRSGATLSPPTRFVVDLAAERIRSLVREAERATAA